MPLTGTKKQTKAVKLFTNKYASCGQADGVTTFTFLCGQLYQLSISGQRSIK